MHITTVRYCIHNHQKGDRPLTWDQWQSCFSAALSYVVSASSLSITQKIEDKQADLQLRCGSLLFVRRLWSSLYPPTRRVSPPPSPPHTWANLTYLITTQDVMFGTCFHFGGLYLRELSHCGWFRSRKITAQRLKHLTHSWAKMSSFQADGERSVIFYGAKTFNKHFFFCIYFPLKLLSHHV